MPEGWAEAIGILHIRGEIVPDVVASFVEGRVQILKGYCLVVQV